jgi:hypothetical protein
MTATSVLATLAKDDPTAASARNRLVLFDDDFRDGLCGWSGLRNSGPANRFPDLHPYSITGPHSMILDSGLAGSAVPRVAQAVKRVVLREAQARWHSRCGWTADNQNYLRYLTWSIDTEDPLHRYWYEIRYTHYDEAIGGSTPTPKWELQIGTPSGGLTYVTIAALTQRLMYNQRNKVNFHDITIDVDFAAHKYVAITLDGVTYDLSGYAGPAPDVTLAVSTGDTDFTMGCNPVFSVYSRSANTASDPKMFIDKTRFEVLA